MNGIAGLSVPRQPADCGGSVMLELSHAEAANIRAGVHPHSAATAEIGR